MKGVIVQTGKPKSIVLLNNGKIAAIPTPADCRIGMVVTVKLNNKPQIIGITLAAILLTAAGIFIGVSITKNKADPVPPAPEMTDEETYGWERGQQKMRNIKEEKSP
jgi:hypothetical protein